MRWDLHRVFKMARLVMKFGGSSVADGAKLRNVGELVKSLSGENEIVVVTSALGGVTDDLLQWARTSAKAERSRILRPSSTGCAWGTSRP